jgi:GNAT superfamily N-acetyltransferase
MEHAATTAYGAGFDAHTSSFCSAHAEEDKISIDWLRRGTRLRRITKTEHCDHLLRLTPADRYLRFGHCMTDANVRAYATEVASGPGLVFGMMEGLHARGVAELQPSWETPTSLELGLSVETHWRGQGYGTELVEHALVAARALQADQVFALINVSNRDMRAIVKKLGATSIERNGEIYAEWPLRLIANA